VSKIGPYSEESYKEGTTVLGPDKRRYRQLGSAEKPVTDNPGDLKGSTQHWLAVYPPEFEIPRFVVAGY
jgi:hypothetical protein